MTRGYHINSNKPKSEFLIPTALKIGATTDIVIGGTTYPEGKDMSFAFAPDEKLNVFTGDFEVDVSVRPLRSVQPGKYVMRGHSEVSGLRQLGVLSAAAVARQLRRQDRQSTRPRPQESGPEPELAQVRLLIFEC